MTVHCLPLGQDTAPRSAMKIVQTPTLIVMLDEDLTYRQIYLDGDHSKKIRSRLGWATRWGIGTATR